ncbi:hypothetical protein SAMN05661010_03144 [Modicisalibacter muralis]|uniref:DUF1853 domain-containing protein n=1 Tax=Modicisalibacter muralis TaxID=119000 RepID=A0A1G9PUD5_9GAMM|nr:DUF1853 family protein [Halomonas muralis]SDM02388.1 hypothetical protein SAMN05661010_03144 [Halomonas muralis]
MTTSMPHPGQTALGADLDRLWHPLVRDLAWLLHAPNLLTTAYPGRPTLDELGLADPQRRSDWLAAIEGEPHTLETIVGANGNERLGHYHEALWHFLLDHAPDTRLLAHNLTIRDDKRTLGELDLLYVTRHDPQPIHLELAIKYYLGLPNGPEDGASQARWIGPGCADSLAIKHRHAMAHQLPLAGRPESAATLLAYGAPPLTQRLAMLGVLFRPWASDTPLQPPRETAPQALFGDWLSRECWPDFCRLTDAPGVRGAFLDKPHWLAPPPEAGLTSLATLGAGLEHHFASRRSPRQLVLKHANGRWQRLFVVGDDWPRAIPLPPA